MSPSEVLKSLDESLDYESAIGYHWQESLEATPSSLPEFLRPEQIRISSEWGGLEQSDVRPLLETADEIANSPALFQLIWHCYRLWYGENEYPRFNDWPKLKNSLKERGGIFILLIILDATRHVVNFHRARGIPEQVTRDTCSDVRIARDRYSAITGGNLGVEHRLLAWFRIHAWGELFRIGRLQYIASSFHGNIQIYKHRESGEAIALNEEGIRFDGEGYIDGALDKFDETNGWTSQWSEDEQQVTASPASPFGMAKREEVTLEKSDWELRLRPGDPVLAMHIPEGKDMTAEDCGESMRKANEFFPKYFPDRPFKALVCASWIFNTQLEDILGPQSNLVRYMRELYLYPHRSNGKAGFYFVWYKEDVDPATAPRDTKLRRAYLDYLERGIPIRNGAMFFLPEDLARYGTQYYRSRWLESGGDAIK